jgi:mono/diheme cytochrome c family protein
MSVCLKALFAAAGLVVLSVDGPAAPAAKPAAAFDFQRDIRPILSDKCFACHGPDDKERKGGKKGVGLRLDTAEGITVDLGDGRRAVVPGQPQKSLLLQRVITTDPDDLMPPKKFGKPLSAREVELLTAWVQAGGKFSGHWAYEKPRRPASPVVSKEAISNLLTKAGEKSVASRTQSLIGDYSAPLDAFILQRLAKDGLLPQPEADRYALARRVALDLTGLPPSLVEVDAFVSDKEPKAYERYVDLQLAKPSYGEHWARLWLDLARYADSAGYADDPPRTIWAFRDYVINAFNRNLPFDQFTIEQLAADLLENPSDEQLKGTAFHRNTMTNNEGGTNDEEWRNAAIVDRVNTTFAVWMGTSMTCAQCHTHKYDPIAQKEYYQLFDFLNQTEDADKRDESPLLSFFTDEQKRQRSTWETELAALETIFKSPAAEVVAGAEQWAKAFPVKLDWSAPKPSAAKANSGAPLTARDDGSVLVAKNDAAKDNFTVELTLPAAQRLTALRLEALTDDKLPGKGPGQAGGNFVVTRIRASVLPPADSSGPTARFVRIELPAKNQFLQLAEVQVFSRGENVALKGEAKQSSTYMGAAASRATDGKTDGEYDKGSVAHTEAQENPWWEVDLKEAQVLERIVVWNRAEAGDRLKGFRIIALDGERKVVWEKAGNDAPKKDVAFAMNGAREIKFSTAIADFVQANFDAENVLNDDAPKRDRTRGWAVGGATGKSHTLTLIAAQPVDLPAGSRVSVTLEQQSATAKATLGHFRLGLTADPKAAEFARTPATIVATLAASRALKPEGWSLNALPPNDRAKIVDYFARNLAPQLKKEREQLAAVTKSIADLKPMTVPIYRELAADKRRTTKVQIRGNWQQLGDEVTAAVPAAWHPLPKDAPRNRLTLAKWLVDENNPLTARVVANRYWEAIFGTGLVRTSEEFGAQGELPSHPELLDWLATELVAMKWDTKKFLRLLVTSQAYRQSSKVTPEALEKDPDNRLLSRGPRLRLTAEMVRDQALAVSGLLSSKMFGPSVRPTRPSMGLNAAFGGGLDWATSSGEDRYRRGLYTEWRRTSPYPSMATFDAPSREVCSVRRNRTNTPLQALVTMNDPVYVETAQALARRMVKEGGATEADKARHGFRLALARPPSDTELAKLIKLHADSIAEFAKDKAKATSLATDPLGPLPAGMETAELAAWTTVANVLLNLDETLMKR